MARYFLKLSGQTIKSFTAKTDESAKHFAKKNYIIGLKLVKPALINGIVKEKELTLNIN